MTRSHDHYRVKIVDGVRRWHAWWRFPHLRSFELHQSGRYWHGRHRWGKILFGARREVWSSGESLTAWKLQGSIFRQLVTTIFVPALFAILLVAGFSHVVILWPALDWPWGGWTLNAEAQLGYLSTLGQISAGMLALYFTAVSVVASTGYARVPGDIRTLIVQDHVASFYFRVLTQFAATTIVMLVALVFGLALGPLNVLLASGLALFGILSFWVLGQRAFRLFDATALSESLNQQLVGAITAATPARFGWNEISLQAHNQRRAEYALNSYRNLITIAAQPENAGGGRLVDLGRSLLALLKFYLTAKSRIPSKSFWFKRANKHKDWLLARQQELDIALATDTSLAPDQIPDLVWFETHVAKLLEEVATELGRRDDFSGLARLADHLREVMDAFGRNCAVTEGLLVARIAGAPILERCRRVDFGAVTESDFNKTTQALAALEFQSCTVIEAFLGTVRVLDQLSASVVEARVNCVVWTDAKSIYGPGPIPRQVVEQLEWVRGCLDFEIKVEGQIVSPGWLAVEMVSRGMVRFLHDSITQILAETERCFGAAPAGSAPYAVADAENCLWGLEGCNKLAKHIERYEAQAAELTTKNRSKEYQWAKVDWADMRKRIAALRNRLVVKLAGCAPRLVTLPTSGHWPDYFGRSYAVLGEETFDAMLRGDDQQFGQIFPTYFSCAFLAMERLGKTPGAETRNYIIQMSPVKDLLDLSGYALLFSALDNKTFEATVRHSWDERFASNADPAWRAAQIALLVLIAEPSLWQEPSPTLRTRWHFGVDRLLRGRRIVTDRYSYSGEDDRPAHVSPLVRAYAWSASVLFEAHDIFLSRYIYQRPEAAGLNKPNAIRSFDVEFERENQPATHG